MIVAALDTASAAIEIKSARLANRSVERDESSECASATSVSHSVFVTECENINCDKFIIGHLSLVHPSNRPGTASFSASNSEMSESISDSNPALLVVSSVMHISSPRGFPSCLQ
jgi:hypothetical protein